MNIQLAAIRIPCKDLVEAEAYYAKVFETGKDFGSENEGYVGYRLDNVTVLLEPEEPGEFECGRYLGFSLSVSDLEYFYECAKSRGVNFTASPERQPWGGVMTHIIDSSGNTFSIIEAQQ